MAEQSSTYDGFISYSHAADGLLAPRLQSALQRFAKPWWRRRAVRIFRDESSLSANPHLWSSVTEALDTSGWFVLLLSPDAAESEWVNQEIAYWVANRDPKNILPVVTDGQFGWEDAGVAGDAVPAALRGVFPEEPRWVDIRWAKDEDQLDLKDPRFADAIADIASTIRGIPKDDLASEEVRQHRRTVRTAWAAGLLVVLLGVVAAAAAVQALDNADRAEAEAARAEANAAAEAQARREAETAAQAEAEARVAAGTNARLAESRELAAAAIANLERDPELATLLALAAVERSPDAEDPPVELVNAIWRTATSNRLVDVIETGYGGDLALTADGSLLAATVAPNVLRVFDAETHDVVWEYTENTVDHFVFPTFSPDGRVALGVFDSATEWGEPVDTPDELPNRLVVFTADGEVEATLEFQGCDEVGNTDWSPDGRYLVVGSLSTCIRNDVVQWVEIFDTETWESVAFLEFGSEIPLGPSPRFDADGNLYALRSFEEAVLFEAESFERERVSEATGIGDVAPDGGRIFGFYTAHGQSGRGGTAFSVLAFDTASGALADILYTGIRYPNVPFGVTATDDGRYVIVATGGTWTHVYDPLTGEERFRLPTGSVSTVAYDGDRELLYTSGSLDGPRVWDLGASSVGVTSTGDLGSHTWVNGNSFAIGSEFGAFAQIDLSNGGWQTGFFDLQTGHVTGSVPESNPVAALANGRFLLHIIAEDEEATAIYDPATGDIEKFFECGELDADLGCLDPGENIVVSVGGDEILAYPYTRDERLSGEVHRLDLETGSIVSTAPIDDHQLVAATFTDEWVLGHPTTRIDYRAVDRETGRELWHDELDHFRHEVSPGGDWLVTRGDGSIQLVDTRSWSVRFVVDGFNNTRGTAFDAQMSRLAVADADSVRLIDIDTGLVAQQLVLPGVSDMFFLDDETLVVGTNTGLFGVVSISTDALIERTRTNLRRSFSAQECVTYRIDPCPRLEEMKSG